MDEGRFRAAEAAMWASVGLEPTERQVPLARTGTTVRVQEVGEGPATVFVHGASNSGVSWAPLVARLTDRRCLVLDRPGCGLSPAPGERFPDVASLGAFVEDLVADLLDGLDLEQADLVVTSFGGWVGLRAAAAHPDRVGRMVLLGWSVGVPAERVPLVMRTAALPGAAALAGHTPATARSVRSLLRRVGLRGAIDGGRFPDEAVAAYLALLRHTDTMANEIRLTGHLMSLRNGFAPLLLDDDLLGSIRTPCLFLWGEDDPFGGPATARAFVERVPGAELQVLPGAGHAPWVDDPDDVVTRIGRFLTR